MRALLFASLALVGCKEQNPDFCPTHMDDPRCGGMNGDGGLDADAFVFDAPPDAPPCFGAGVFEVCPMGATTGTAMLSGNFDTGTGNAMCASTQPWKTANTNTCFVVANTITVMAVRVTGARPLALVANTINVIDQLDVSSRVATGTEGPNSLSPGACGSPSMPVSNVGAGGGAGASFAPPNANGGKNGGKGDAGSNGGGGAVNPTLSVPPGTLRGGCRGQTGGTGQGGGGVGGYGGGAVYLVAATTITLGSGGIINASGAGGAAAGKTAGGGGGGSGGMIILWAQSFAITAGAIVVANGGSGSTGGDGNGNGAGARGNDPDPTQPMSPALGPTTPAGDGGNGFAGTTVATVGGDAAAGSEGGGGGGGGGGYIQSNMDLTNATVSPGPNVVP